MPIAVAEQALAPAMASALLPALAPPSSGLLHRAARLIGLAGTPAPAPPDLVVVVDTSGSMGPAVQICSAALARLAIRARGNSARIRIIAHTSGIDFDRTFTAASLVEHGYPVPAGGGTDYRPALDLLAREAIPAAMWLTDGDGHLDTEAGCAITWVVPRMEDAAADPDCVAARCQRGELTSVNIDRIGM
jgi:predicted metal-dependent peptidase